MGNYASCSLSTPLLTKSSKTVIRVIFPGGEVRQFRDSLNAAELMMELPGFFAAESRSLHVGRRFSALSADEDLEFGRVYVMFPMRRVSSVVTAADLAVFFMAVKRISGGCDKVRVLPHSGAGEEAQHEPQSNNNNNNNNNEINMGFDQIVPEFKFRLAACRSRKPKLETIKEEPILLR